MLKSWLSCTCYRCFMLVSARRLERIIKDVLDDFGEEPEMLKKHLIGRPVDLAEELSKFVTCLW